MQMRAKDQDIQRLTRERDALKQRSITVAEEENRLRLLLELSREDADLQFSQVVEEWQGRFNIL